MKRLRRKVKDVLREVEKFTSMKSKGTFAKVKGTLVRKGKLLF